MRERLVPRVTFDVRYAIGRNLERRDFVLDLLDAHGRVRRTEIRFQVLALGPPARAVLRLDNCDGVLHLHRRDKLVSLMAVSEADALRIFESYVDEVVREEAQG